MRAGEGMIIGLIILVITVVLAILFLRTGTKRDSSGDWDLDLGTSLHKGWIYLILIVLFWSSTFCIYTVQPGYRGVQVVFGSVQPTVMPEGLNFKLPWVSIVNMKVMLEIAQVSESTASRDLQEITTELAVHYNVAPDMAHIVYQNMRQSYESLLLIPVIQEDLKATTAQFTAEQLITQRPLVVLQLESKLRESIAEYGIVVKTVNIVDFQFSPEFSKAIELKVQAEQEALMEKNVLEKIRWQQEQEIVKKEAVALMQVIQARADANKTIIDATAKARQTVLAAQAEAEAIMLEARAKADAILLLAQQLTPEYIQYMYLIEWDGQLPGIITGEGTGFLLNIPR